MAHTEAACEQYLKQYPSSEYASKVKELKVAYAFEETKAKNSLTAYRTFLNKYGESVYADEAVRLTEDALMKRYFNSSVTIGDLEKYVSGQDRIRKVDDSRILALYTNLQIMPTAASMMECKGLIGTVTLTTLNDGMESEEEFVFNRQGLLEKHHHSRSGRRDEYQYDFDTKNGFRLISKTDNKGNITKYSTTFDANGLLAEMSSSNGEKVVYSFNDNQLNKITHYNKSGVVKTDYYDSHLQLEKSVRNGVTIVYKYNSEGDVVSMSKMKGNTVMESTTYDYEYSTEGLWTNMVQNNNGNYFLTKSRQFDKPVIIRNEDNDTPKKAVNTLFSNADAFDVVEQMPTFPGGEVALLQFLNANVHYPEVAEENGIQGRVIVSFVVERDGTVTNAEVVKSVDPLLDKEAVRVIRSMPRWKPGIQDGKPVRVKYTTPVTFRLQ
jgi:TonB family protein